MTRILAKVRPHHVRIAHHVGRCTVGNLTAGDQHDQPLREMHHRTHDVLDQDDRDALFVQPNQQRQDVIDLAMRQACHGLVRDQQARRRGHCTRQFKFPHFDLGQVARQLPRFVGQPNGLQQVGAALLERAGAERLAVTGIHRVEQRNAQVLRQRERVEGPRQLEAAREAKTRALVRGQAVKRVAGEAHTPHFVAQRAAHAVHQRALT